MGFIFLLLMLGVGAYYFRPTVNIDPTGRNMPWHVPTLEKYDFDELRKQYNRAPIKDARTLNPENVGAGFMPAQNDIGAGYPQGAPVQMPARIEILGNIPEIETRRKLLHSGGLGFTTQEIRFQSDGKWVSGMINYFPEKSSLSPIIIMLRGYAEKEGYYPGSGSWKVADELAKAGFATISLDFLGYGHSDVESSDMLEARFHKVVEVL